ncbi:MAG TPA: hypothetical protein VLX29_01705 [Nitrospirota bacterium]|nr:hypothetical protein [Nitrospirota bacterium]
MSKIKVYYFEGYNICKDEMTVSQSMAPLKWIEKHGFTPIKDTAKEIDASSLDSMGLYRKKRSPIEHR